MPLWGMTKISKLISKDKMLEIDKLNLIGEGGYKMVFEHPTQADKVIKIMRPERVAADGGFKKHGYFKRNSMQGVYRQFRREIIQYLQLCKNNYAKLDYKFPIETPYGLVATNLGLGLVVEKIVAPVNCVQSLGALVRDKKLEDKHLQALEVFFEDCKKKHVVYGEVNANGIMYTEARNARPEFVLVDGIGEKLLIPVRSWSKKNNDRYIEKVKRQIKKDLEI